ncbi:MAG: adenine deaminase [Acidobacteria bacterium]|nr:adenine deaminase [Acidobacteriota bacterium]
MDRQRFLAVARGEEPADLLITGGRVVEVFTGEILELDVAVAGGRIAGLGSGREGMETLDAGGAFVVPGLIDPHVHLESSLVTPLEFARAVVPRGTTAVVCDPHELANVAGLDGIRWLLEASEGLPLTVYVNAPSCVPATHLATAGAELSAGDLAPLLAHPRVLGLAEVMNVPGTVLGDPGVWAKLEAFRGRPVDGHAPGLAGPWLDAYVASGPATDHECMTAGEAREKLRRGMRVFLRQGTAARNLVDLLPAVDAWTAPRCAFCTDDRHPHDLLDEGHMDHLVRLAVASGLKPELAIRLASLGAAEPYGLTQRGAVAPGRRADLVLTRSLEELRAEVVLSAGRVVGRDGRPAGAWLEPEADASAVRGRMRVDLESLDLGVPAAGEVRVIGIVPGQLLTEDRPAELPETSGRLLADPSRDIAKLAVIERHRGSGRVGLGFVQGLGFGSGAVAGTVAHDHHNLMVAGMDDRSMTTAARAVAEAGGGLAVAAGGRVAALLPLPIAGLISDRPLEEVRNGLDALTAAFHELGGSGDPFMMLSFLGLEVIPALKLTDRGLVDVERFEVVPLRVTP